jgi:tRNA threonylcarbamoyladenosine biosynthesis protein TsaB
MLILGIESASSQVGCAIGGHEGVLASIHSNRGKRHAEVLTPQIDVVRRHARVELSEIGLVAVDIGPGLYTGLRVGISAALAVAYARNLPMIGVPSLDLLAFPMRFTSRLIVTAMDARRGELFFAFYRPLPGGVQRIGGYRVGSVDDLAAELMAIGEDVLLVGDGALRYGEVLRGVRKVDIADHGFAFPTASSLVQLAHAQALREDFVKPSEIRPLYLRVPDVDIGWTTRDGRTGA